MLTRGDRRRLTTPTTVAVVVLGVLGVAGARAAGTELAARQASQHAVVAAPVDPVAIAFDAATAAAASEARATTPYTAMWLWENPVHLTTDARGRGYDESAPDVVAQFAVDRGLSTVHVATPWAANEGEVASWLDDTVEALHARDITVSLLGGDETWLSDPSLGAHWVRDAVRSRDVDRVQLSLEPWSLPSWQTDRDLAVAQWLAAMDAVRAELPSGVELGLDAPYWLATAADGPEPTLFDEVLARADSVAIVTFVDRADGDDGIVALSAEARAAANAARVPFTIGVETESPRITGGAEYTFFDDGVDALDEQAALVAEALRGDEHYQGIAVERFRTWRDLVDPPSGRYAR